MSGPWACDGCLRRSWLIGSLSARIETELAGRAGSGSRELLALPDRDLAAAVGGPSASSFLQKARHRDASRLRTAIRGAHAWACCRHDGSYPARLGELRDMPAVLFGRGDRELLTALGEQPAVTVVGSRRPSAYGREIATRIGGELGTAGLIVVSGMALGIDSCAHEGALAGGGRTVAVLGSGPDVPSPAQMARLYERIADEGLILSELPPGTSARRWTFPARNRIMAALAAMTVVVEARQRSGSLITATMAADLGREVGAVPGPVGSSAAAGTNALLRDGAQLVRGGDDVLDSMLGIGGSGTETLEEAQAAVNELEPELAVVLEQVELGAATTDAVSRACGLGAGDAAVALVKLELRGLIRSDSAGRYRRSAGVAAA